MRGTDKHLPDAARNFTLKELFEVGISRLLKEREEIFHNIESKNNKMLKVDPKLEKNMPICQGIEKIFALVM